VLSDLSVLSFADMVGLDRPPRDVAEARARFGGVPAPILRLRLDKDRAWLA
jgi:levansucrase